MEKGTLTYAYSQEQRFQKGVILSQGFEDFGICADVDKYGQGMFGNRLYRAVSNIALRAEIEGLLTHSVVLD